MSDNPFTRHVLRSWRPCQLSEERRTLIWEILNDPIGKKKLLGHAFLWGEEGGSHAFWKYEVRSDGLSIVAWVLLRCMLGKPDALDSLARIRRTLLDEETPVPPAKSFLTSKFLKHCPSLRRRVA